MKTKLPLLVAFMLPLLGFSQTTIVDEDFSSGSLPSGWTNVANVAGNKLWTFNDPGNRNISTNNFSGNYAIFDSDEHGTAGTHNATLTTPSFNAGLYATITLEFDHNYNEYSGDEICKIEVYNGSSWVTVETYQDGDENDFVSIDITSAANGASNAAIRFTYEGDYDWWWALDNVKVTGESLASINTQGPGGVGSSDGSTDLRFWIDANSESYSNNNRVTTMNNNTGYGNHFTASGSERPTFAANNSGVNNMSTLTFDGNNQLTSTYNGNPMKT